MYSQLGCMGSRELCHGRHTVTLSTDHTVFSLKYHGKILVEKTIALALDGGVWRDIYRIKSSRMPKRNAQALYLSARYSDFGRLL